MRELRFLPRYLLVVVLRAPSGRFWAAAACSEPVGFPTPQGRRPQATGPQSRNIAAGAYVSLRPVGRGKLAWGVAALLRQTSGEQRGFWFILNCPRGIGGCSNLEAARQAGHG